MWFNKKPKPEVKLSDNDIRINQIIQWIKEKPSDWNFREYTMITKKQPLIHIKCSWRIGYIDGYLHIDPEAKVNFSNIKEISTTKEQAKNLIDECENMRQQQLNQRFPLPIYPKQKKAK